MHQGSAQQPMLSDMSSLWQGCPQLTGMNASMFENTPVVSILDRKVQLPPEGTEFSLYELCRDWVQNNPEADRVRPPEQLPTHPPLPQLPAEAPVAPPQYVPDERANSEPEETLRRLKEHWVAVRHHHQSQQAAQTARVAPRLQQLLSNPPGLHPQQLQHMLMQHVAAQQDAHAVLAAAPLQLAGAAAPPMHGGASAHGQAQ